MKLSRIPSRAHGIKHALLSALLLAVVMLATAATAHAEAETIGCEFLEIEANNSSGNVDPKLNSALAKKLKKPPFSSWKSFSLRAQHERKLPLLKAEEIQLAVGGKLSVLYRQHTQPTGKRDRFALTIELDSKSGKRALNTQIVVDARDHFVIALSSGQENATLLALSCQIP